MKHVGRKIRTILNCPILSGVPALPVLWLYCAVKGTRLVVDWHNYSHTILQVIKPSYNEMMVMQCTGQDRLSYHLK